MEKIIKCPKEETKTERTNDSSENSKEVESSKLNVQNLVQPGNYQDSFGGRRINFIPSNSNLTDTQNVVQNLSQSGENKMHNFIKKESVENEMRLPPLSESIISKYTIIYIFCKSLSWLLRENLKFF